MMAKPLCTFREADQDAAASIANIYNQYLGKTTMDIEEKDAAYFEGYISRKGEKEKLIVAESETVIIGYGIIKQYSDREGYKFSAETSTYLDESQTGKGYGSALQEHLIDQARKLGLKHLVAKIWSTNTGSIQFHERHGYQVVGTQQKIGYVNGDWQDVTIMQYIL